jgi:rhodanese-related sulfurtransferase
MHAVPPDVEPLVADELARHGAMLLDVREPDEFAAGHAPGAVLIPVGDLEGRLAELDADDIVCVCRTGARSAAAAELLRRSGIAARNLLGGMHAWAAEGLPVTNSEGGSGIVV